MNSDVVASASTGSMAAVVAAGFPVAAVIPVCPPTAAPVHIHEKSLGKAPARYGVDRDGAMNWIGLYDWVDTGCGDDNWSRSADAGANAGIRMGTAFGSCKYVFVDIDPQVEVKGDTPEQAAQTVVVAQAFSDRVIALLRSQLGDLWVRQTVPGRAGTILRIPEAADPGVKTVFTFTHASRPDFAAVELLTRGQQAVVAGVHRRGARIRWVHTGTGEIREAPPSGECPLVSDFAAVVAAVDVVAAQIGSGITVRKSRVRTRVAGDSPEQEPAPPADLLTQLLDDLPNDADVRRGAQESHLNYLSVFLATGGCVAAGLAEEKYSAEDVDRIRDAVVNWACRWPGSDGWAYESGKWDHDFSQRDDYRLGWRYLVSAAASRGLTRYRVETAQTEFGAAAEPVPLGEISDPGDRRQAVPAEPESDVAIASHLEPALAGRFIYVGDEDRWLVRVDNGAWSHELGGLRLRREIEELLPVYAAESLGVDGGAAAKSARVKTASRGRVDAAEISLRGRLCVRSDHTHLGVLNIQTPAGAFCLRTGSVVDGDTQGRWVDTRVTSVAPSSSRATPLFDDVISHFCGHDAAVIAWFWAYCGYMIAGKPDAQALLILEGPGGNGKGVICRVLSKILGNYAIEADRRILLSRGRDDHPTAKYDLRYKRMWYVDELPPEEKWNEAELRALSGGNVLSARRMRENLGYFTAEGTLLVATNHIPALHRVDDAIVRRFRIIRCYRRVPDSKRENGLEARIVDAEGPAILSRLVAEAKAVIARGRGRTLELPPVPPAIAEVTAAYLREHDLFSAWFRDECEVDDADIVVPMDTLRGRYDAYCRRERGHEDAQVASLSPMAFATSLRRQGVRVDTTASPAKTVSGLRLRGLAVAA